MSAAIGAVMTRIGERTGLYRAMAGAGWLSSDELAERAGCAPRYVREWLSSQAAAGYVEYDPGEDRFRLPDEHAVALADEDSPVFMLGVFDLFASLWADEDRFVDAFRTGQGIGWHEHDHRLFSGTERFFRPGYKMHLVGSWIPALEGVEAKLKQGAKVADVGCGHGASTVIMAEAYPNSMFVGYDYHGDSIARARQLAAEAGVGERCVFEVASAQDFPGGAFDLICNFDCLHDMGDPVGAARHAAEALATDGTYMIVEPMAGDSLADNLNPVGRMYYSASAVVCTANALSQEPRLALGAQAGEPALRVVLDQAGFSRVRRATETPFNMVLEARL
ncbi:MAG TPA: class I SAM-dependent methyltransferase [Thermoleophilaceae bacterium]